MSKKIIAINSGSSSLKFQLFNMPEETLIAKGLFERIGLADKVDFTCKTERETINKQIMTKNHQEAVDFLLSFLLKHQLVNDLNEISGVGHRVAHGGEYFTQSSILNQEELKLIEEVSPLAPLHNPVNLVGINAFRSALPESEQVGVFDTSFHQTIEKKEYIYPIPYKYYSQDKIRKYGFHGTSHQFVAEKAAKELNQSLQELNMIICHIGNGASICGIKDGKSALTSMGFTPLAGLMMGTRCGDIDPSIVTFLQQEKNYSTTEILQIMNEQSGLLGVSELSNDSRDILESAKQGNEQAKLALDIYASKIRQTIGAYATELGRLDAVVFTAGVGENSSIIREMICQNLGILGIQLDKQKNEQNQQIISTSDSQVSVMVIPTNEELMIAKDTYALIYS